MHVFAYELLFRSSQINAANVPPGEADRATSELIVNALTEFGLKNIVGDKLAFINLTRNFVVGSLALPESEQQLILEVLEDIEIDNRVLDGIQKLKHQGYRIALDDFIFHESRRPLIAIANIIKIDLLPLSRQQLAEHVKLLKQYPVKLLAEKVETQEDYNHCLELGFDYFQGYFFCKPSIIGGTRTPSNRLALLNLLSKLCLQETGMEDIERLIAQDVSLSLRLLRYINSSQYSLNKKVDSIHDAIFLLGQRTIRNLASLMLVTSIDNKPFELFVTALIRAHMCELLGERFEAEQKSTYFMIGLFSVIDAMFDKPMAEIIEQLPLNQEVCAALVDYQGIKGQVLQHVIAYEQGDWQEPNSLGVNTGQMRTIYLQVLDWCHAFTDTLAQLHAA